MEIQLPLSLMIIYEIYEYKNNYVRGKFVNYKERELKLDQEGK